MSGTLGARPFARLFLLPSKTGNGSGSTSSDRSLIMKPEFTRRSLLMMILGLGLSLPVGNAYASDDGGNSGSGSSGSGSSGSGSSGSGGNSGSGGGDDSDDHDDRDSSGRGSDDDDDDNDNELGENGTREAQEAQRAVRLGKARPLRELVSHLDKHYPGKILDVDLKRAGARFEYRLKILQRTGKVIRLRLDAKTLALR
ncbi:MAG: hypothetical protein JNM45_15325 [Rhizobiales bacterium]|nr:hypothetical protein [Hyphomicrobiales bacterium]